MQRLSSHILSLLRHYNSVAVPGIGVFSREFVSANFDRETLLFIPPHDKYNFSVEGSQDDLLIDSYRRKYGLTEEEAENLLMEDLLGLSKKIENEGEVKMPGIGSLIAEDSILTFIQEYPFGNVFPVISMGVPEGKDIEETCSDDCAAEEEVANVEYRIPEGYHYHRPEYFYLPLHKGITKVAASFLLVVVVALVALFPVNQPQTPPSTASISPVRLTEKQIGEKPLADAGVKVQDAVSQEKVKALEVANQKDIQESKPAIEDRYYAVVAAFKSMQQVESFIGAAKEGKGRFSVVPNGSYNLVTIASSPSREELQNRMSEIRSEYSEAWIYEKK